MPSTPKSAHPMWMRWLMLRRRNVLCAEWRDFSSFVESVGDPGNSTKLQRLDAARPYGPTNFRWSVPMTPERNAEYLREWRAQNPDWHREKHFREKYGIGIADYEAMRAAQNGRCAICGAAESRFVRVKSGERRRLAVDHDHDTGEVRALLCGDCNVGLGAFGDDQVKLFKAVQYLASHKQVRRIA